MDYIDKYLQNLIEFFLEIETATMANEYKIIV